MVGGRGRGEAGPGAAAGPGGGGAGAHSGGAFAIRPQSLARCCIASGAVLRAGPPSPPPPHPPRGPRLAPPRPAPLARRRRSAACTAATCPWPRATRRASRTTTCGRAARVSPASAALLVPCRRLFAAWLLGVALTAAPGAAAQGALFGGAAQGSSLGRPRYQAASRHFPPPLHLSQPANPVAHPPSLPQWLRSTSSSWRPCWRGRATRTHLSRSTPPGAASARCAALRRAVLCCAVLARLRPPHVPAVGARGGPAAVAPGAGVRPKPQPESPSLLHSLPSFSRLPFIAKLLSSLPGPGGRLC